MKKYTWDEIEKKDIISYDKNRNIIIYGMGGAGIFAYEYYVKNKGQFAGKVYCCDRNKEMLNTLDVKIDKIGIDEIENIDNPIIAITPSDQYYHEIVAQFNQYECISFFELVFAMNYKLFQKAYQIFEDEDSKDIYVRLILARLNHSEKVLWDVFEENQYFAEPVFNLLNETNVYVDCGAYVGDTVETYISKTYAFFKKIYAFEPGSTQFTAMERRVKRLCSEWAIDENKIVLEKSGVGEKTKTTFYRDDKNKSSNRVCLEELANESVKLVSLDEYFEDAKEKVTMLKLDIEGHELAALKGAQKVITRDKPKMAICVYHRIEDLYELPLYMKEHFPEYEIHLHHHSPQIFDTVMYCY